MRVVVDRVGGRADGRKDIAASLIEAARSLPASCSAGETGVGDAGVGGHCRRATTRGCALSFGFPAACLGASTTMSGSAVVPFPAGAGVCDSAGPPKLPSRSEAAPEATKIGFEKADMVSIPMKPRPNSSLSTNFGRALPSTCDGTISIDSAGLPRVARRALRRVNQSMSGDRGSARLETDASGIQMNEFGVGGQVKKFDGLRQQQHRRRRK